MITTNDLYKLYSDYNFKSTQSFNQFELDKSNKSAIQFYIDLNISELLYKLYIQSQENDRK